jgi:hypothetical protein
MVPPPLLVPPPLHLNTPAGRPPRWQRWVLNALHNFDRRTIGDWVSLMVSHFQRPNRATPMATAHYTVQLIGCAGDLRTAAQTLAAHAHPASRALLADATFDFQAALDNLCSVRVALLKIAGAQRVTGTDE